MGLVSGLAKLPNYISGRGFSGGDRDVTLDGSIPPGRHAAIAIAGDAGDGATRLTRC